MGMKLMSFMSSLFAKICVNANFYAVFALALIQNMFEGKILIIHCFYHYKVEGYCYKEALY